MTPVHHLSQCPNVVSDLVFSCPRRSQCYISMMPENIDEKDKKMAEMTVRWVVDKLAEEKAAEREQIVMEAQRRHYADPSQVRDFGKHVGETYGRIFVRDEDYCGWAVRQMRPRSEGLNNFKYYVMRTNDVGQKMARRARAEEVMGVERG